MSQSKVYLCPSCQSVVRSETDATEGLTCGECGFAFGGGGNPSAPKVVEKKEKPEPRPSERKKSGSVVRDVMKNRDGSKPEKGFAALTPTTPLPPRASKKPEEEQADIPHNRDEESILPDGTRQVKRRKRRKREEKHKKLYLFITAWIGVIVALFLLFQVKRDQDSGADREREGAEGMPVWEREFYQSHLGRVARNFRAFNKAPSMLKKQQFIDRSSSMAAKFSIFHTSHPMPEPVGELRMLNQNILELRKEPLVLAIETQWADEEGRRMEAVHVWDRKGWKLDWEHFARYSTTPWTLFRSGLGKKEGEFRLFVRKRRTLSEATHYSLLFYAPAKFGDDVKTVLESESPEVQVKIGSELGRKVRAVLSEHEDGRRPLESILGDDDPTILTRISVKLAWEANEKGEEELVLKDVVGVSWYGERIREIVAAQAMEDAEGRSPEIPEMKDDLNESTEAPSLKTDE